MIGYLSGTITHKDLEKLIVDVGGVGYEVAVTQRTLNRAKIDEPIELFIHTYVREDIIALYGFTDAESLEIFRYLISVSGVGPKTALDVLSSASVDEIKDAVAKAQTDIFSAISGIGKKTAGRIILDLQAKLGAVKELDFKGEPKKEEALQALINLGYKKSEALAALKNVDGALPIEEQIKAALKKA